MSLYNPLSLINSLVQNLVEGVNIEDVTRKLHEHQRINQRKTDQANHKREEVAKNLQALIQCENARLNFNYYEKKALEDKIQPEDKERAERLLQNLELDKMDKILSNNVLEEQMTLDEGGYEFE